MNIIKKFYLVFIVSMMLVGCLSAQSKNKKKHLIEYQTIEDFRNAYHQAWVNKPNISYNRRLIHVGIPENDKVVLWYLFGKNEINKKINPNIVIKHNGKKIKRPNLKIYHIKKHHTGRLEISGLKPNKRYEIEIRLLDEDKETINITAWTAPSLGKSKKFSFLVYSCFQPYSQKHGENQIYSQTVNILNLLKNRANDRITPNESHVLPPPSFILGLGDQIYVDPDATSKNSVYSLLTGNKSQVIRAKNQEEYNDFLDEIYRRHFAIPPFDKAHRYLPSAMMWDDHEIRDGWGSQGDENDGSWDRYYSEARAMFIAYQALRNPTFADEKWDEILTGNDRGSIRIIDSSNKIFKNDKPMQSDELYTSFEWANVSFFIMDLRSQRNKEKYRVISEKQMIRIKDWLKNASIDEPKLFVLGSSIPLMLPSSQSKDKAPKVKLDLKDDVNDSWDSKANEKQRNELINILISHFRKNKLHKLLILSGDVHFNMLMYLKFQDGTVFGHELISSGLSRSDFNQPIDVGFWASKFSMDKYFKFRAYPREYLVGPHFAEVMVEPNGLNNPPNVKILLYLSRAPDKKMLSNLASDPKSYPNEFIELRYDQVPKPKKKRFFWKKITITNTASRFTQTVTNIKAEEKATNWNSVIDERDISVVEFK